MFHFFRMTLAFWPADKENFWNQIPECNLLHNSSIAEEPSKTVHMKTMTSRQCFAHAIQE